MKIGKYPVKRSYNTARLIADVFSAGLTVFIFSVEYMFMTLYEQTLTDYIGEENIAKLSVADPTIGWKHWITLVFPVAVLAVFAAYIILVNTSHRFSSLNLSKRNAQKVYDMYAMCVSLCKIPALMFINEMMIITHNKMLMSDESWFSVQLVLDLLIVVMLILIFRRILIKLTAPAPSFSEAAEAVRVKAVVKPTPENADKAEDTERN